ncbi:hypothetical protein [Staphylococcus aureus]|uniref:hypothetical protein n=1 Tax=Staphylococcus aureus TaxID=1280 RepID=UPI003CC82E5B
MQRDYLIRVETESMLDFKRLNGLMIGFVIKGEAHIYDENNMTQCNRATFSSLTTATVSISTSTRWHHMLYPIPNEIFSRQV